MNTWMADDQLSKASVYRYLSDPEKSSYTEESRTTVFTIIGLTYIEATCKTYVGQ